MPEGLEKIEVMPKNFDSPRVMIWVKHNLLEELWNQKTETSESVA